MCAEGNIKVVDEHNAGYVNKNSCRHSERKTRNKMTHTQNGIERGAGSEDALEAFEFDQTKNKIHKPNTLTELEALGWTEGIPKKNVCQFGRAEYEKINATALSNTPLTHALWLAGYDIRLGEKGRADLKQEISRKTSNNLFFKQQCVV